MAKLFIQKATENAHGQFKAKAEAAGMSTKEYAEKHQHDGDKTGKQARLALTLIGMSHKDKSSSKPRSIKDNQTKMYGNKGN